jgi:hypothetical protein
LCRTAGCGADLYAQRRDFTVRVGAREHAQLIGFVDVVAIENLDTVLVTAHAARARVKTIDAIFDQSRTDRNRSRQSLRRFARRGRLRLSGAIEGQQSNQYAAGHMLAQVRSCFPCVWVPCGRSDCA